MNIFNVAQPTKCTPSNRYSEMTVQFTPDLWGIISHYRFVNPTQGRSPCTTGQMLTPYSISFGRKSNLLDSPWVVQISFTALNVKGLFSSTRHQKVNSSLTVFTLSSAEMFQTVLIDPRYSNRVNISSATQVHMSCQWHTRNQHVELFFIYGNKVLRHGHL